MNDCAPASAPFCVGEWLASDQALFSEWMTGVYREADGSALPLHPVLQDFKAAVEHDAALYALVHQMFEQVPSTPPYDRDPTGKPQARNFAWMLQMVNERIATVRPAARS